MAAEQSLRHAMQQPDTATLAGVEGSRRLASEAFADPPILLPVVNESMRLSLNTALREASLGGVEEGPGPATPEEETPYVLSTPDPDVLDPFRIKHRIDLSASHWYLNQKSLSDKDTAWVAFLMTQFSTLTYLSLRQNQII